VGESWVDNHASIVIKKVKKGGHGGHHGGAWKVAYADFVTAMMAFFLLLWLLNATTEEQKMGISNYFDPTAISRATRSGSGGVLGGTSITVPGALKSQGSPPMITTPQTALPQAERTERTDPDSDDPENIESRLGSREDEEGTINQAEIERLLQEREDRQFEQVAEQLQEAIENTPGLAELEDSIKVEQTSEGLRIQLLDQERYALFESGSAGMSDKTRELLLAVANIIKDMPQKIEISGHTDAVPFAPGSPNDNFSLSSARADASRRFLETSGVPKDRVQKVVGRADREPLIPENPFDPANRRISVTLLSIGANDAQALSLAKEEKARQEADDGAPAPANADTAVQGGGPPALPADGSPPLPPGGGPPAPAPSAPVAPPPVTGTVPGTAPAQVGSTARDVGNPPAVIQPN
jgi:chemotaxis protein MotB